VRARRTVVEPVVEARANRLGARRGSAREAGAISIRRTSVLRGRAVGFGRARSAAARIARRAWVAPEFERLPATAQDEHKDSRWAESRSSDHSLTLWELGHERRYKFEAAKTPTQSASVAQLSPAWQANAVDSQSEWATPEAQSRPAGQSDWLQTGRGRSAVRIERCAARRDERARHVLVGIRQHHVEVTRQC
jgi:hypothetical protein